MDKLNQRQIKILEQLGIKELSISELQNYFPEFTKITLNRDLKKLIDLNLIESIGKARATRYSINQSSRFLAQINPNEYFKQDIDDRNILKNFNMEIFETLKSVKTFFSESEKDFLLKLNEEFQVNYKKASKVIREKELERFVIELSWKSSKIEGNTYNLLDTETLIKSQKRAKGKSEQEALMILNHKKAFDFIYQDPKYFKTWTKNKLTELHFLLLEGLEVSSKPRENKVKITGSNFEPLDDQWQIEEALTKFMDLINTSSKSTLDKALLCLAILSYIQIFEDGNKRTSRLAANASLLANGYCPLSFRSIDEDEYKKAVLLFYEQNNLNYLKKLFIEQFEYACENYLA